MSDFSFVYNAHPKYIESLYEQFKRSPEAVEPGWRSFFQGFDFAKNYGNGTLSESKAGPAEIPSGDLSKEFGVMAIIHGFRDRGHLLSTTNPIRTRRDRKPHLDLADYGLSEEDLNKPFQSGQEIGLQNGTLKQILDKLHVIYCGNIGFEYTHIEERERRMWLRKKIEERNLEPDFGLPVEKKRRILEKLNGASVFEKFLHTKYIGQKRFSLEGGETTIPALDAIISKGAEDKVDEVVIGMAHRGRLNVLANIMGKTYEQIFNEFEGDVLPDQSFGDGDVKYHLGYSSQVQAANGKMMQLKLAPNPSHLEAVNPVVEGFARAKADLLYDSEYDRILPILIHGDAAVAGQGVVYETVQMSKLPGYYTGGTIHFVINNQIGFTTDFDDARSSTYSTGVASVVQAPVFHVNGDDPDAVIFAVELATEYRQKFNNDVFIDMVCYRKHGHNEGDDPKFTQPEMYDIIHNHPDPRELYSAKLHEEGEIEAHLADELEELFWKDLQARLDLVKENRLPYHYQEPEEAWRSLKKKADKVDIENSPATGIPAKEGQLIIDHLMNYPDGFQPLKKVNRLQKGKQKLLDDNKVDWALAELMAYGSILKEGKLVRMSGQDVKRGTFSHRHAVFYDAETFKEYNRLNDLGKDGSRFMIYNSLLSEFAVLGFEYGYSMATPNVLVLWEAQFGDFYNGAQVMIDQFISSSESKWQRMSGLVMLLPHGYEGQGPEHSSARLERFLQQCADDNMTVANLTTPANFFHLLRRQLHRPFRKPVVLMSPKSLLRHPLCVSDVNDLYGKSRFREILDDDRFTVAKAKKLRKVLFCSGKVYYDLLEYQEEKGIKDVAIVRVEQLYPIPREQWKKILGKYKGVPHVWVQEESENMGAWQFINYRIPEGNWDFVSRRKSASPATGFKKIHDKQQADLLERAFA